MKMAAAVAAHKGGMSNARMAKRCPKEKRPPENSEGLLKSAGPIAAYAATIAANSPLSYISIMMSEPPTNSPLM